MERFVDYLEAKLSPAQWRQMLEEMLEAARQGGADALVELLSGRQARVPPGLEARLSGLTGERAGVALFWLLGHESEGGVPAKVAQVFRGMSMRFIKKFKVTTDAAQNKTAGSTAYFMARAGLGHIDFTPHPARMSLRKYRELMGESDAPRLVASLRRALLPHLRTAVARARGRPLAARRAEAVWTRRLEPLARALARGGVVGYSPDKDVGLLFAWLVDVLKRRRPPLLLFRVLPPRRRDYARALRRFDTARRKRVATAVDALRRPLASVNLEQLRGTPCPREGCGGLLCRSTDNYRSADEGSETRLSCTRCDFQRVVR
jgi:hypothetical protein